MTRNLLRSRARCLCGLRATLHFTADNRKLTCAESKQAHRQATVRPVTLRQALIQSIKAVKQ